MRVCNRFLPLLSFFAFSAVADVQTVFTPSEPRFELASLSSRQFTTIAHPAFPGRQARIKKSDFCDGGVAAYTGYIDVGTRHLFFYFFESRSNPDSDDVLLWTNGGPGGSSSVGLFMELGPCTIDTVNSTKYNPHSWNTKANIFFIDQPVGVGFSYADYGETVVSTEEAAKDIAAFILMFFETFSKFKGRAFHLTGESFAGRYLPVYASAIYDQNQVLAAKGLTPINLKSVAIGNGVTNFFSVIPSYHDIQCTNASGIEPLQTISNCVHLKQLLPRCERWFKAACIEMFDKLGCSAAFDYCFSETEQVFASLGRSPYDISLKCTNDVDCYPEQNDLEKYLNQSWVQDALGAVSPPGNYAVINMELYKAFWLSGDLLHQNELYVAELLERGVRVLIYAGAYDVVANWVGNERWTRDMEWSGAEAFRRAPMRDWLVDGVPAGRTRAHGNLTFATVSGAGHLVPHDKPVESLKMIQRWLAGESL